MRYAVAPDPGPKILDRPVKLQDSAAETGDFRLVPFDRVMQSHEDIRLELDIVVEENEVFAVREGRAEIAGPQKSDVWRRPPKHDALYIILQSRGLIGGTVVNEDDLNPQSVSCLL